MKKSHQDISESPPYIRLLGDKMEKIEKEILMKVREDIKKIKSDLDYLLDKDRLL